MKIYLRSQRNFRYLRLLTTTITLRLFQCGNMAREGLRTLVVSKKVLPEEQYQDFEVTYPPPPSLFVFCPISCSDVILLHLMLFSTFCEEFSLLFVKYRFSQAKVSLTERAAKVGCL